MPHYDITLLTDHRYVNPTQADWYVQNILDEDRLLKEALEKHGLKVTRTNWDNPDFDWSETRFALFRTTWDYFNRWEEFSLWLDKVSKQCRLINPESTIRWNLDKHYLLDLEKAGVAIPQTIFIEPGDGRNLSDIVQASGWQDCILKPAISGAARHTYRITPQNAHEKEEVFAELIANESMLLQEFQHHVVSKGEVALMVFGGKYSHAVLKKAKPGDFRVQDDFGGTLHDYTPSEEEIAFAEHAVAACAELPAYARVDMIWDNAGRPCVGELELVEPELWFRREPVAAERLAEVIAAGQ